MRVPLEIALIVYGAREDGLEGLNPNLNDDMTRAVFFAVWAMLEVEMEEALREARKEAFEAAMMTEARRV